MHIIYQNNISQKYIQNLDLDLFEVEEIYSDSTKDFKEDVDDALKTLKEYGDIGEVKSISVPISFFSTPLDLTGISFLHHIRLTRSLNFYNIPLFVYGSVDLEYLIKIDNLTQIFSTPRVRYIDLKSTSLEEIPDLCKDIEKDLFDYSKDYLERIKIEMPANYDSRHSIANEWSLSRYAKLLSTTEKRESLNTLNDKIEKSNFQKTLYAKYSEAIFEIQKIKSKNAVLPQLKQVKDKRIAIIDDEIEKGWEEFYRILIEENKGFLEPYKGFRKEDNKEDTISKIKKWIDTLLNDVNNPTDIFIVDLRLHYSDNSKTKASDLSGIEIIKYLKSRNLGIQLVVISASNKIWNFQECMKFNVNNFAVKESPESTKTRKDSQRNLNHIASAINTAAKESRIAECYRKISRIKRSKDCSLFETDADFDIKVFADNDGILDSIITLLAIDQNNKNILNHIILLCISVLELYCEDTKVSYFPKPDPKNNEISYVFDKEQKEIDIIKRIGKDSKYRIDLFKNDENGSWKFSINDEIKPRYSIKIGGLDKRTITKFISVLWFRHQISYSKIQKVVNLRQYRSTAIAHSVENKNTGEKNQEAKIENIEFFINLFEEMFVLKEK